MTNVNKASFDIPRISIEESKMTNDSSLKSSRTIHSAKKPNKQDHSLRSQFEPKASTYNCKKRQILAKPIQNKQEPDQSVLTIRFSTEPMATSTNNSKEITRNRIQSEKIEPKKTVPNSGKKTEDTLLQKTTKVGPKKPEKI